MICKKAFGCSYRGKYICKALIFGEHISLLLKIFDFLFMDVH